jgi:hypothetical protein
MKVNLKVTSSLVNAGDVRVLITLPASVQEISGDFESNRANAARVVDTGSSPLSPGAVFKVEYTTTPDATDRP